MEIKLLVEGGAMQPGPALAQKIGPLGLNVGQIIQKVNEATKNFKGLKVPVELTVDAFTKNIEINVFSPPVSELLKKELGIEKGSGMQKKQYVGNMSIEQIISVAKTKQQNMLCKDLKSTVKTILGTCVSLGILVENKLAKEIEKEIESGKYSKEIKEGKTETLPEKRNELDEYFKKIQKEQEKALKLEKEAAEAKEAAKAGVATAEAKPGEVAKEGEATKPVAAAETAKKEAPKKEEKKKK